MKRCSIHEQFNKANLIFKLTQLQFFLLTKGENTAALEGLGEPMQLSYMGTILCFVTLDAVIPRESLTSEASKFWK